MSNSSVRWGGVDDEARVAPRGTVSDPVLLEQENARLGRELGQSSGGSEPGDACAHHNPVGNLVALEAVGRRGRRQYGVPPRGMAHVGEKRILAGHGAIGSLPGVLSIRECQIAQARSHIARRDRHVPVVSRVFQGAAQRVREMEFEDGIRPHSHIVTEC